jgi:hypothetical protein
MVIASTQGDYLESIAEMEKQKTELEKQLKSLNKKGVKYR